MIASDLAADQPVAQAVWWPTERGCGAAGSAPHWQRGGQGLESPQLHRTSRLANRAPIILRIAASVASTSASWSAAESSIVPDVAASYSRNVGVGQPLSAVIRVQPSR